LLSSFLFFSLFSLFPPVLFSVFFLFIKAKDKKKVSITHHSDQSITFSLFGVLFPKNEKQASSFF